MSVQSKRESIKRWQRVVRRFVGKALQNVLWLRETSAVLKGFYGVPWVCEGNVEEHSKRIVSLNHRLTWTLLCPETLRDAMRRGYIHADPSRYSNFVPIYLKNNFQMIGLSSTGELMCKRPRGSEREETVRSAMRAVAFQYSPYEVPLDEGTLETLQQRRPLLLHDLSAMEKIVKWAYEMARNGICVCTDLCPSNIFLGTHGEVEMVSVSDVFLANWIDVNYVTMCLHLFSEKICPFHTAQDEEVIKQILCARPMPEECVVAGEALALATVRTEVEWAQCDCDFWSGARGSAEKLIARGIVSYENTKLRKKNTHEKASEQENAHYMLRSSKRLGSPLTAAGEKRPKRDVVSNVTPALAVRWLDTVDKVKSVQPYAELDSRELRLSEHLGIGCGLLSLTQVKE